MKENGDVMATNQLAPLTVKSQTEQSLRPTDRGHLQSRPAPSTRLMQVKGPRHSRPSVPDPGTGG